MRTVSIALLAVAAIAAGCSGQATGARSSTDIPHPSDTAAATPHPFTEEDLANAIRYRTSVKLRADEPWIQYVAAYPEADWGAYGTPLTPTEKAYVDSYLVRSDVVAGIIDAYGRGRPDWAGMFFEHVDHDRLVALFAGPLDEPRAWIAAHVSPDARWAVRQVARSYTELQSLQDRVSADEAFLASVDSWFVSDGIDVVNNGVILEISSRNPDAPAAIVDHFDGGGWLRVTSDGVAHWTGPLGTLVIRVVTPDGHPVRGATCVIDSDDPAAFYDTIDMGIQTIDDGSCRLTGVAATWFEAKAYLDTQNERRETHGRVQVIAGGVTEIRLVLPAP